MQRLVNLTDSYLYSAPLGLVLLMLMAPAMAASAVTARFSLLDHHGMPVTEQTYRGKWLLVFFGYTSCPDICPTTLYDLSRALEALGEDARQFQALFVSVDPERDTVDVLARYIPAFGPAITGLTGDTDSVAQAARAFRAYYEKVPSASGTQEYTVDHQSYIYLIRPDGEFETAFPHGMKVDRLVDALRAYLAR